MKRLVLLLCSSFSTLAFAAGNTCTSDLAASGWANAGLTSPAAYVRGRPFRFLVHALANSVVRSLQASARFEYNRGSDGAFIDLEWEPERVAEKGLISASLIDQTHLRTWADVGLILEPSAAHVIAAEPEDMGSPHVLGEDADSKHLEETIANARRHHRVDSPETLLRSAVRAHNEVLLRGTTADGVPLRLVGFFLKVNEVGESEVDPEVRLAVRAAAARLRLPLIQIDFEREGYADADFEVVRDFQTREVKFISWNNDGVRHVVQLRDDFLGKRGEYTAMKFMGHEKVTSPEHHDRFVAALRARCARDAEIKAVLAAAGVHLDRLSLRPAPPRTPPASFDVFTDWL